MLAERQDEQVGGGGDMPGAFPGEEANEVEDDDE